MEFFWLCDSAQFGMIMATGNRSDSSKRGLFSLKFPQTHPNPAQMAPSAQSAEVQSISLSLFTTTEKS
jgi:hypothetical protein